jgi:hypothetical protein
MAATDTDDTTLLNDVFEFGRQAGHLDGYGEGYAAGLALGLDLGASRVLIHGPIPDLSPGYRKWKDRLSAEPECPRRCRRCSACVRIDWLERHGGDYTGAAR